jgi:hypothetical protein
MQAAGKSRRVDMLVDDRRSAHPAIRRTEFPPQLWRSGELSASDTALISAATKRCPRGIGSKTGRRDTLQTAGGKECSGRTLQQSPATHTGKVRL